MRVRWQHVVFEWHLLALALVMLGLMWWHLARAAYTDAYWTGMYVVIVMVAEAWRRTAQRWEELCDRRGALLERSLQTSDELLNINRKLAGQREERVH